MRFALLVDVLVPLGAGDLRDRVDAPGALRGSRLTQPLIEVIQTSQPSTSTDHRSFVQRLRSVTKPADTYLYVRN